jgi:hypothetical protein
MAKSVRERAEAEMWKAMAARWAACAERAEAEYAAVEAHTAAKRQAQPAEPARRAH